MSQESPVIYFDSHPEPPAGFIWNSIDFVRKQLVTAWTGHWIPDVQPGELRLQWYTDEGKFGKRDYELRQFEEVRLGFDELCKLPEVTRCMILGYPSQNPYSIYGESPYALQEREKRELLDSDQYKGFIPRSKKGVSVGQRIDEILDSEDKRQVLVQQKSIGTQEA